jgi:hypothetical protein
VDRNEYRRKTMVEVLVNVPCRPTGVAADELDADTLGGRDLRACRQYAFPSSPGSAVPQASAPSKSFISFVSTHISVLRKPKRLVDRCVFDGKRVLIPMRSSEDAAALVDALCALSDDPRIEATVED